MFRWIKARRPAMVAALVEALLVLAIAFGADLDEGQVAALASVAAVVFGFLVQEVVTPTAKVRDVTRTAPTLNKAMDQVAEIVDSPGPITKALRAVGGLFRRRSA